MKQDKDYGGGLTRLADPEPDEWIADKTVALWTTRENWTVYGNFWPDKVCKYRDHQWKQVKITFDYSQDGRSWPRVVGRCQRCGAQVWHDPSVTPPRRGEW